MRYREFRPSEQLSRWVRGYWVLEGAASRRRVVRVFPDGCMELIVHLAEPFESYAPLDDFLIAHSTRIAPPTRSWSTACKPSRRHTATAASPGWGRRRFEPAAIATAFRRARWADAKVVRDDRPLPARLSPLEQAHTTNLTHAAIAAGYFDQAHFRTFKVLTRLTPSRFFHEPGNMAPLFVER